MADRRPFQLDGALARIATVGLDLVTRSHGNCLYVDRQGERAASEGNQHGIKARSIHLTSGCRRLTGGALGDANTISTLSLTTILTVTQRTRLSAATCMTLFGNGI